VDGGINEWHGSHGKLDIDPLQPAARPQIHLAVIRFA
jgi:hypothetical protein